MDNTTETLKKPFGWGAKTAILVTLAIYFLTQFAAVILLSVYSSSQHWSSLQANQWLNDSVFAQFAFVALVELGTLGLLYLFLRRYRANFKDLGLVAPKLRDTGYALAGFGAYFPLYIVGLSLIRAVVPSINIDQKQQLGFTSASGSILILVFISLVILPPLVEEILVRGFLYGSLKKHWPKLHAIVFTSLLFAIAHLQIGSGAPLLWVAAIDTFILSFVLIYLRDKTGGLAASIMLHMLKNGLAFAALFIFRLS